jgi:type III restriction enzyme
VKNFGLNFTIPYLHNGKPSDYLPDFVARLNGDSERYLITEVKGADWDDTADIKALAAHRWCAAINAAKRFGHWDYLLVKKVPELTEYLNGQANIPGASSEALTA